MQIKDIIKGAEVGKSLIIERQLNSLFRIDNKTRENRKGMHGSGIIVSDKDFCHREQVISFFYKGIERDIPDDLRRIFLEGNSIHEKWQKLFVKAGIDYAIEQRGHSKDWELLFTPDAKIKLNGIKYVVEIKSVNTYQFQNMKSHPSAEKQLQVYMHFECIPDGFVLCEDKNTQKIKVFDYRYDPLKAKPYVERLLQVKEQKDIFEKTGKLPKRICEDENCKRAKNCSYREACFNIRKVKLTGE